MLALARSRDVTTNLEASLHQTITFGYEWHTSKSDPFIYDVPIVNKYDIFTYPIAFKTAHVPLLNYLKSELLKILTYLFMTFSNKLQFAKLPFTLTATSAGVPWKTLYKLLGEGSKSSSGFFTKINDPIEQRPNPPMTFPVYCLINRDPYNGFYNPYITTRKASLGNLHWIERIVSF